LYTNYVGGTAKNSMGRTKQYTIKDVAKEAGVSITTISRYLSGQFQYMSKDTRERISTVINEFDYHPSLLARGLKSRKSCLIGVVMPHVHTPMSSHSIRGVCMACANTQFYNPVFVSIEDDVSIEPNKIQKLIDHRVEGILSFTGSSEEYYRDVVNDGIPVVCVDRYSQDCKLDGVYINHYDVVYESLVNLIDSGYTKIALFSSINHIHDSSSTIKIRENSYRDFVRKHLKNQGEIVYSIEENDIEDIKSKIMHFINRFPKKRKAIFVSAMSGLATLDWVCKCLGLSYPEDIAVYGYAIQGDISALYSGLTTIAQPLLEMSQIAFDLLIKRIDRVNLSYPQRIVVPAELIIRKSTL